MAEYIDRTELEPDTEWSDYDDGFVSYSQSQIRSMPKADVVERDEFEKVVKSFKTMVEMKNENLIAMRDKYYTLEKEYAELKVNIDKAIEEIEDYNIKTNFTSCSEAFQLGVTRGLDLASEILKRNIGE